MKNKLLIYELDCLYSLLTIDNKILTKIFSNIIVPQIVYDKFKCNMNDELRMNVNKLLKNKFIILADFEVDSQEFVLYKKLVKGIECKSRGRSESAAITIAKYNQLTILSKSENDYYSEFNIKSILITDLIVNEYHDDIITIDEAQILWDNLSVFSNKYLTDSLNQLLLKET